MRYVKKHLFALTAMLSALILLCLLSSCGGANEVGLYDGDTLLKKVSVKVGEQYEFGIPSSKPGYTFCGWYSDKFGNGVLTDAQGSSAGMTWQESYPSAVYAGWQVNKYKISLDYCGATALDDITEINVQYDSQISERFPVPQKKGFSFLGWYTEKTNGKQITDASGNILADAKVYNNSVYPLNDDGTTLYAHWGDKTVTYIFSTDGELKTEKVTYPIGTVLHELPFPVKENCCFVSWCLDQTLTLEIKFPYTIPETSDGVVMLYAKFETEINDALQFTPISGDKEYEVSYEGNDEKVVIPDSYYGKPVTCVRRINSSTVKEIILPQTITKIINGAFENCTSLKTINIPVSLEAIPDRCFSGCSSLTGIVIPIKVKTIGKEAFAGCSSVTEISLSDNVTQINGGAFKNMSALKEFLVGENNERYVAKDGVLYRKTGMSLYLVQYPAAKEGETYDIDPSTIKILEYAFSNSKITSVKIGGKISAIEQGAFENCVYLTTVSISGETATFSIGKEAFLNCSNLKALKVELEKIPTLDATAFNGVAETFSVYVESGKLKNYANSTGWRNIADSIYSLGSIYGNFAVEEVEGGYTIRQYFGTEKEIVIPEIINARKIVGIAADAFAFSDMERITISKNVKEIGDGAFRKCDFLKSVIMECTEPPVLGDNVFDSTNEDFGIYIKGGVEALEAYKAADKWSELAGCIWSYANS